MKTHPSKRYPFFSAFADYYLLSILILITTSVASSLLNRLLFTAESYLLMLITLIIILTIYHAFLWKKTKFLSPGERMIGGTIENKKKVWMNPFGKNRNILFIFIFIALITVGTDWGNVTHAIFPIGIIIGKSLRFLLVYPALIYLGIGRIKIALLPAIVFLLSAILLLLLLASLQLSALIILNAISALLAFIVFSRYE